MWDWTLANVLVSVHVNRRLRMCMGVCMGLGPCEYASQCECDLACECDLRLSVNGPCECASECECDLALANVHVRMRVPLPSSGA